MEDIIARLFPYNERKDGYAHRAVTDLRNSSRFFEAESELPGLQGRSSRETTAPPDDDEEVNTLNTHGEGLQLTFTHPPKAGPGFVFGTDSSSCDIVLPRLPGISRRHCYLTFDDKRRLIVRDCSTNGTIVEYAGKGGEKRRNFTWVVGGHDVSDRTGEVVIQIHLRIRFEIVVFKPAFPQIYYHNVDRFLEDIAANTSLPFGALGIQSIASTVAPSGAQTPTQEPIFLEQRELGKGAFAVVSHVWDVSTGIEYASKRITNPNKCDWRKEASLMRNITHEHIIRLYFVIEAPRPQLILEYMSLGNLEHQNRLHNISEQEISTLLEQGLAAITFLHEQTPPVVHRDIKPENILVASREPFCIKFGDFGLSKASENLETPCGTYTYLAPEIAKYLKSGSAQNLRYTHSVDVWSFGVVIFEYAYNLPQPGSGAGLSWCKKIVRALNDWESDGLVDILSGMIVLAPGKRYSARLCWERATQLGRPNNSLTPISDARKDRKSQSGVVRYSTIGQQIPRLLEYKDATDKLTYGEKRKRSVRQSSSSLVQSEIRPKKIVAVARRSSLVIP